MLRWGVIGAGRIAGRALAPAMRAAGHDIAMVGSRSPARAREFASVHGARDHCGSYEGVLEADDVDAVYIGLPNDLHEPWTVAALQAGKHVLCEKPLALDAAAVGRMAAVAADTGMCLAEAAMWRYHPRTVAVLQLLAEGGLGTVRLVHSSFAFRLDDLTDIRANPAQGGGALLDLGFYGVTASRWLVGEEPSAVTAQQIPLPTGVDGTTAATLAFPSGALASVHASFTAAHHEVVNVVGADGRLHLERAFTASTPHDAVLVRDGAAVGSWRADPYECMLRAFADAVGGRPALLGTDDALATAAVLDRIRTAAS